MPIGFICTRSDPGFWSKQPRWKTQCTTRARVFKYLYCNQHKTENYNKDGQNFLYSCEIWACLGSHENWHLVQIFKCQFLSHYTTVHWWFLSGTLIWFCFVSEKPHHMLAVGATK
jgi:hypothetical protein